MSVIQEKVTKYPNKQENSSFNHEKFNQQKQPRRDNDGEVLDKHVYMAVINILYMFKKKLLNWWWEHGRCKKRLEWNLQNWVIWNEKYTKAINGRLATAEEKSEAIANRNYTK